MKKKKIILDILLVVCIITAGVSGYFLYSYYHESHENQEFVSSLKDMIEEDETEETSGETGNTETKVQKPPETVVVDDNTILKRYQKLYEKNHDFIGWISIEGTKVDYPVMQCKEDEQRYMRKNFDKEYALAGTPFLAAACDAEKPSTNLIIYGHNMKDNTMFGTLSEYTDHEYWEEHKTVHFDTIYGLNEYEVVAAFHTVIPAFGQDGYQFYAFVDPEKPEELDEFVNEVQKKNELDTVFSATMNDHLLMLSTCDDYGAKEGRRFLVIAKRKE